MIDLDTFLEILTSIFFASEVTLGNLGKLVIGQLMSKKMWGITRHLAYAQCKQPVYPPPVSVRQRTDLECFPIVRPIAIG